MNYRQPRMAEIAGAMPPRAREGSFFEAAPVQPAPDASVAVSDLWLILSHRRGTIVATALLFGLLALLYGVLTSPLYTASVQILIDPRDRQVVTNDLNASGLAPDGGVTQVESQVKVIQSNAVLLRAIRATDLLDDPEFVPRSDGPLAALKRAVLGGSPVAGEEERNAEALAALRRRLAVKRADKVFVVDVVVTTTGADKSARIADAIAAAYLADGANARARAAERAAGELGARLDGLRNDLARAEKALNAFKAGNGLIASDGRLVNDQQLNDINARLVAAQGRRAEAQSRLRQSRDAKGDPTAAGTSQEALNSVVIERLRQQYAELSSREADLRMHLGARHPDLLAAQAQEADVRRLIGVELDRISRGAETDYRRAVANEASLTAALAALKANAVKTAEASGQMRELEQDVDTRRTVYNDFLLRSRQITEQATVDPTNARVIGTAIPPTDASWPPRLLLVLAGLAGGLSVGAGLAMGREYWKPTLLSPAQVERLLGIPVLASLPARGGVLPAAARLPAALLIDGLQCLARPGVGARTGCVVVTGAPCDAALRGGLIDLLASVATARGARVLVADADLQGPGTEDPGLLDLLGGRHHLLDIATEDPGTGAWWIGLGRKREHAGAPLAPDAGRRFLHAVDGAFDLVIVDGGSLSSNLAAGALVAAADQLLGVFSEGVTPQSEALDVAKAAAVIGKPITAAAMAVTRAAA